MKKLTAILLVLSLLLCGCSELIPPRTTMPANAEAQTEAPQKEQAEDAGTEENTEAASEETTEPETEPETEPAVIYRNPLNGKVLDAPFTGRIYSVSINNLKDSLPHVGVVGADMVVETFVNGSIIRCFAMFSEPEDIPAIGSIRSCRIMWNDLTSRYDTVMVHAGGSSQVLGDANNRGLDHMSVDVWNIPENVAFRDKARQQAGYGYEHTLFAVGSGLDTYAESKGYRTTLDPDIDYGMTFADDATPADGVNAENFTFTITVNQGNSTAVPYKKDSTMVYNAEKHAYEFWQYGMQMVDGTTGDLETYNNVFLLEASIGYNGIYQQVDWEQGGEGWFACGGKAQRIAWHVDGNSPIRFTTLDGEPLTLNVGRTYIALTRPDFALEGIG